MSKRRHNFGTKRFKEKSLFIFHARIVLKSLILLFVRLIARGARIGKTHTHTHTDKTSTVTLAHARRGLTRTLPIPSSCILHCSLYISFDVIVLVLAPVCLHLLHNHNNYNYNYNTPYKTLHSCKEASFSY